MLFIDNKYTRTYFDIIETAKKIQWIESDYTEKHHIIPKSYFKKYSKSGWIDGNPDDINNIVVLSARQHYICHLLLTKMTEGLALKKSLFALTRIVRRYHKHFGEKINSRLYSVLKEQWEQINPFNDPTWQKEFGGAARKGKIPPNKGKSNKDFYGEERAKEISQTASKSQKGKIKSKSHRKNISETRINQEIAKGSTWFNNGIISIMSYECPVGFVKGRGTTYKNVGSTGKKLSFPCTCIKCREITTSGSISRGNHDHCCPLNC